jgi:hypothetical protein
LIARSLSETLAEAAHARVEASDWERDQEAWNLPRAPQEATTREAHRDQLGWEGFVAAHFPKSRRHNLEAIVAYGAYRSMDRPATEPAATG